MRALVCKEFGPPGSLVLEHIDDPVAGDGEILVDVAAAGLNFPDVLVVAGQYQVKSPLPFVPGNEGAGTVSAAGNGANRFSIGDKVVFTSLGGAFADKCVVDEQVAMPMPESMSFDQGAGFPITYGTSYHALKQSADLVAGETLLVLGAAGGVGTTAVEIGKAMGARVIAAASSDEKLEFAREVGADECINYSESNLKESVKALTDGAGADVVYDPVGGELAQQALRSLAWHGRYLVIGFTSGSIPEFPANIALLKEASIIGVWWGPWSAKNPAVQYRNWQEMRDMLSTGVLKPRVTAQYALEDYVAAFEAITARRVTGKTVFAMA